MAKRVAALKNGADPVKKGRGRPPGKKAAMASEGSEARTAGRRESAASPSQPADRRNQPSPHQNSEWLAEYTRLQTESRRVSGLKSALAGRVRAAAGPIHWKGIKRTHDRLKLDPEEARAELECEVSLAAQQNIKIAWMGNQAVFADVMNQNAPARNTKGSRDLASARAETDGFNSGKNGGLPHDNPFKPGTQEYVSWHDGRDAGQQARESRSPQEAARIAIAKTADHSLPSDDKAGSPQPGTGPVSLAF